MSRSSKGFWRGWPLVVAVTAVMAALDVPARLVLTPVDPYRTHIFDWLYTIVFGADVLVALVRSDWRVGTRARPGAESPGPYPRRWLGLDLAAAIPFVPLIGYPPLHLLRLLKLARVAQLTRQRRREELHNPALVRLVTFLFWVALGLHWLACGWLALRPGSSELSEMTRYLHALYWSAITLAAVGYGDITPSTNVEMMYAILTALLGVAVFGYVVGSAAGLLANLDPARVRHREIVERMTAFMRYRQLPPSLQQRILDYYEYLWDKRLGYDEATAIGGLPPTLKTEVSVFLHRDIIQNVPLFRRASDDFVRDIALEMRPLVFMPGDYIIRAGDAGEEMYFISHGTVEVVSRDDQEVYATLTSGQFFGEIALLFDQPRNASVRAVEYCDLYCLGRASFERILSRHPDIAADIAAVAQERQEANKSRRVQKDSPDPDPEMANG